MYFNIFACVPKLDESCKKRSLHGGSLPGTTFGGEYASGGLPEMGSKCGSKKYKTIVSKIQDNLIYFKYFKYFKIIMFILLQNRYINRNLLQLMKKHFLSKRIVGLEAGNTHMKNCLMKFEFSVYNRIYIS